jgi:predicted nucleotidyltransferase
MEKHLKSKYRLVAGTYSVWDINNGYFLPFSIKTTQFSKAIIEDIRKIKFEKDVSIYLRGSCYEEEKPHPKSDIDIVIIGTKLEKYLIENISSCLEKYNRPVEISFIYNSEIKFSPSILLLLSTRSKLILGKKIHFPAVPANLQTMADHYYKYCYFLLPDTLKSSKTQRLHELKNLTRNFGIVYFMQYGLFSRDIYTCLKWAYELNYSVGEKLEGFWNQLNHSTGLLKNWDITTVKDFLKNKFENN